MAQRKDPIPDSVLKNKVTQQLANRGLRTPCRIHVDVRKGVLTLTGHVHYPHQRDAAMAAVRSIDGLSRIHEQIQVRPPAKHQYKTLPPLPKKTDGEVAAPESETGAATAAEGATAEGATAETATAESAPVASAAVQSAAEVRPAAAAVADDLADFELGPVRLTAAARAPSEALDSASATASAAQPAAGPPATGGETIGDEPNETDFELGPAKLAAVHSVRRDRAASLDQAPPAPHASNLPGADEDDSSTTDFDLGPAPVKSRPAS